MIRRVLGFAVAVLMLLVLMPTAASAVDQSLLTFEHLFWAPGAGDPVEGPHPGSLDGGSIDCDAGTFEGQVSGGIAHGPYPGSFSDSVSASFTSGMLTSFAVDFEVISGGATVSGSASWTGGSAPTVTCTTADLGEPGDPYVITQVRIGSYIEPIHLDYTASIDDGSPVQTGTLHAAVGMGCEDYATYGIDGCEGSIELTFDSPDLDQASGNYAIIGTGNGEATADDPTTTMLTSPSGGPLTISEGPAGAAPSGYSFIGQEVSISAPPATPEDPLYITFRVDSSVIPDGEDSSTIVIFRDGIALPDCVYLDEGGFEALPCVTFRSDLYDGDARFGVATDHASAWTFGVAAPVRPTTQAIIDAVAGLPDGAFKAGGHRTAMSARLAGIQASMDTGKAIRRSTTWPTFDARSMAVGRRPTWATGSLTATRRLPFVSWSTN